MRKKHLPNTLDSGINRKKALHVAFKTWVLPSKAYATFNLVVFFLRAYSSFNRNSTDSFMNVNAVFIQKS